MATYFVSDFSGVPTGWTKRWNTTPTWTGANPLTIPAGATADWTGLTLDSVDSDANRDNVEILVKWTTQGTLATTRFLVLRGSGADESATHYHFSYLSTQWSMGYCAGSDTRTNIANSSLTFATSTTYWTRIRVNSTTLQARTWADGGSEPGTWGIDTTDSNVTGVGWVGFVNNGTGTGVSISQIGVGTNGDTAPSSGSSGAVLESAVSGSVTTAAALTTGIACAASVTGTATGTAALASTAAALASAVSGSATTAAALTTGIACAASVNASATTAAALTAPGGSMAAAVSGTATTAAALTTAIRCAASVNATATVTAALAGSAAALAASVNGAATVNAALGSAAAQLAAAAIANAQATAALSTAIRLAAGLQASATTTAALAGADTYSREPTPVTLLGVPASRSVQLGKVQRRIGTLLKVP